MSRVVTVFDICEEVIYVSDGGRGVTMLGSQGEALVCLYHKSVQLKSDSLNVGKRLGPNHTH